MDKPAASRPELWRRRLQRFRAHGRSGVLFAAGVLAMLLALLLYGAFTPSQPQMTIQEVNDRVAEVLASATPPPAHSALVYRAIRPSLIFIQTEVPDEDGEPKFGLGSGVVINDMGDIITSLHVVTGASDIQLTFADGTQSGAQIIVEQADVDIAVLRASRLPAQLVPATLGNPNSLRVGDETFAVGNPLGLYSSMSAGVISGLNRSFAVPDSDDRLEGLIQFDAAVNPGNSGGPLLNRSGHVIGIVTGLANPSEQDYFIGIGFAVPINIAGGAAGLPPY